MADKPGREEKRKTKGAAHEPRSSTSQLPPGSTATSRGEACTTKQSDGKGEENKEKDK